MTLQSFGLLTTIGTTIALLTSVDLVKAVTLYSVADLPFLPSDLNDRGQVVGQHYLWNNGTLTDLKTLPGAQDSPLVTRAINNQGILVGEGFKSEATQIYSQAFRSDGQTVSDLGIVGSSICQDFCVKTIATTINNQGQIGFNLDYQDFQGGASGYVQQPQGERQNVFPGHRIASINDNGKMIGYMIARGRSGPGRGLMSDGANTRYLDAPGYCFSISTGCFSKSTQLSGMNNLGQVVGFGAVDRDHQAPLHALVWKNPLENSIALDLATLGGVGEDGYNGKVTSLAYSINNTEQIVGLSYTPDGDRRAVLWQDNTLIDLNQVINNSEWKLTSAQKINNQGQIVGIGYRNGQEQGFLLNPIDQAEPVPEPVSTLALLIGAATIGYTSFRRRNAKKIK
ncbi:PEP-CTERM sorting domain-containing protein [Phormidesmis sp. 146-33]